MNDTSPELDQVLRVERSFETRDFPPGEKPPGTSLDFDSTTSRLRDDMANTNHIHETQDDRRVRQEYPEECSIISNLDRYRKRGSGSPGADVARFGGSMHKYCMLSADRV